MTAPLILLDFWGVIGVVQTRDDLAAMAGRLGVDERPFTAAYWQHRPFYDAGGGRREYWSLVAGEVGQTVDDGEVAGLGQLDVASWSRVHPEMLDLIADLRQDGRRLALLSNAPLDLVDHASRVLEGLVPELLFSSHLGLAKPDPAIFAEALRRLQVPAAEVVFVDDNVDNVRAARDVGMVGVHHISVALTRDFLEA